MRHRGSPQRAGNACIGHADTPDGNKRNQL